MARTRQRLVPAAPRPDAPVVRMNYDAAKMGRRSSAWKPPATGPNRAQQGLDLMVHRSRDAARNDWGARTASLKWGSSMIGVGIVPRFKRVPEGKRREYIADLWTDFVKQADADCALDFYGQQTLAVKSWFTSGEVFARLRPRPLSRGLTIPLQVQLVEADMVPRFDATAWPGMPATNTIRQGIERDPWGERVAYWMYREHPGDAISGKPSPFDLVRVPASSVLHVYEPDRPGELRGAPQMASVLMRLRNTGDLEDNVQTRMQLANLFTMFVTKPMPDDSEMWDKTNADTGMPEAWDTEGRPVATLEPGISHELAPGEKVEFANPPEAGVAHSDYLRTLNMGTAAGGGMPYELYSGDIRGVSDRALRVILLEFRRLVKQRQWQMVIPQFCQRVVEAFAKAAALAGKIRTSEVDPVSRVEWSPHGFEHIHPLQDPQGQILEVQAGLRSRAEVVGARGDDVAQTDQERHDDKAREERLGLAQIVTGAPAPKPTGNPAAQALLTALLQVLQVEPTT